MPTAATHSKRRLRRPGGSEDAVLRLVGDIYDAALVPDRWPGVVRRVTEEVGGHKGLLFTSGLPPDAGGLWAAHAIVPESMRAYGEYYHQTDLWMQRATERAIPTGVPIFCERLVPDAELVKSEWYNDFLRGIGIFGALSLLVSDDRGPQLSRIHLSIFRPPGSEPFDAEAGRLIETLHGHLARGLETSYRLTRLELEAGASMDALDRIDVGVVLFDGRCQVVAMNRKARRVVQENDGLTVVRRRLVAASQRANRRLRRTLDGAVATAAGAAGAGGASLAVDRPSGRRPYAISVVPVSPRHAFGGQRGPAAILFVADPERRHEVPPARLRRVYGLTPAEAALAAALAMGESLRDYAERTAISPNTARSHLKQVFDKTDTHSQAELVGLVLAGSAIGNAGMDDEEQGSGEPLG